MSGASVPRQGGTPKVAYRVPNIPLDEDAPPPGKLPPRSVQELEQLLSVGRPDLVPASTLLDQRTLEGWEARVALRHTREVVDALALWWRAVLNTMQPLVDESASAHPAQPRGRDLVPHLSEAVRTCMIIPSA